MGLYNVTCSNSGLFFLGITQIIYNLKKRQDIIEYVFSPVYIDPYSKSGWEDITSTIEPHGTTKLVSTGATPSKPPRQGDGQTTPFNLDKSSASCSEMYNKGVEKGLFINSDFMKVELLGDWNQVEQMNHMMRWNAICEGYVSINAIYSSTKLLWEAISPLYKQNGSITKSPAQMTFFGGPSCLGKYFGNDSLSGPPWEFYEVYNNNPFDLIGTLYKNFDDIWFLSTPNGEEVEGTESFVDVSHITTQVTLSDLGVTSKSVISNISGSSTTQIVPDPSNYSKINLIPRLGPIDTDPISFTATYKKILLT